MGRAAGITNAVNVGIAVQADWENREFVAHISLNVRRLFDFLVQFGIPSGLAYCPFLTPNFIVEATTKTKLAALNDKLNILERRLEMLEVQVASANSNPSLFST